MSLTEPWRTAKRLFCCVLLVLDGCCACRCAELDWSATSLCPSRAWFDALVSVRVSDDGSLTTSLQRPLIWCVPSYRYANCLALHLLASRSTAELFGAGTSFIKRLHCLLYCLLHVCDKRQRVR